MNVDDEMSVQYGGWGGDESHSTTTSGHQRAKHVWALAQTKGGSYLYFSSPRNNVKDFV